MRIVGLCLLACGLSGCHLFECEAKPCSTAITVRVVDAADGGALADAQVDGVPCNAICQARFPDGGIIVQAGTFELLAEAPGYRAQTVEVVVPAAPAADDACCPITYVPQQRDITLQPL